MASRPARIETAGRLVEQQHRRVVDDRLGQLDPLFHAGRVFVEQPITGILQFEVSQHLVGTPLRLPARHAAKFSGKGDIFDAAQAGNQSVGLGHEADQSPQARSLLPSRAPRQSA